MRNLQTLRDSCIDGSNEIYITDLHSYTAGQFRHVAISFLSAGFYAISIRCFLNYQTAWVPGTSFIRCQLADESTAYTLLNEYYLFNDEEYLNTVQMVYIPDSTYHFVIELSAATVNTSFYFHIRKIF